MWQWTQQEIQQISHSQIVHYGEAKLKDQKVNQKYFIMGLESACFQGPLELRDEKWLLHVK
jgi:hypothetical protein